MSRIVRVALTQTCNAYAAMPRRVEQLDALAGRLDDVRQANLEHHLDLIAAARGQGAQLVCLGELFAGPYFALTKHALWRGLAEDAADGPSVRALRAEAREHGLVLIVPIYELERESGRRFNTAVVIDERGLVLGSYRKTHIPCGSNERGEFHETFYYERSDGRMRQGAANVSANRFFPVFQTALGRIGVAICYDRHFEGVLSTLKAEGAELVLSPAVTFGDKSRRLWHMEFAVEAARHGLYVGGCNRKGAEQPWGVEFFGQGYVCGPQGVLKNDSTHPELVMADVDLDTLAGPDPAGWNLARDARPELYSPRAPAKPAT